MSWPIPRTVPQLEVNMENTKDAMRRTMMRLCFWIMMVMSLWVSEKPMVENFWVVSRKLSPAHSHFMDDMKS
jgi:hypothetical protein